MSAIPSVSHAQFSIPATAGKYFAKPMLATAEADTGSTATISQAAQDALASSNASNEIDVQLAAIKAKDPMSRTPDDVAFMQANDPKLAANLYKINHNIPLTSAEIDYDQKTMGFVNSFALLSDDEKALYDKAVASGNQEAAAGISVIAMIRTLGHTAGGKEGTTYDPIDTEITADNVRRYFSYSIVDATGKAQSQFDALIRFLESQPAESNPAHNSAQSATAANERETHQSQRHQESPEPKRTHAS